MPVVNTIFNQSTGGGISTPVDSVSCYGSTGGIPGNSSFQTANIPVITNSPNFNPSGAIYTTPRAGKYRVTLGAAADYVAWSGTQQAQLGIAINGAVTYSTNVKVPSTASYSAAPPSIDMVVSLNAGATIQPRFAAEQGGANVNWVGVTFSVEELPTNTVISASDVPVDITGITDKKTLSWSASLAKFVVGLFLDTPGSNCIDIGPYRIQWGTGSGGTTVSFPMAYSSAPHVIATVREGSTSYIESVIINSLNQSNFLPYVMYHAGTTSALNNGRQLHWFSIGAR